ncbi:type II toxin-antitoxin system RelE/ParE family toxin [Sphingomonas sp.]|uniref:type II toxin-antitoxin system RelE/ParE family toxin n=1 Tax=Sphingomonas sp. TaxID=28214 RepID=UPI0035BC8959
MIVHVTGTAGAELEDIRRWIARDNRPRATSFIRELRSRIAGLTATYELYPIVDSTADGPIHRMNYHEYRIFYQVSGKRIDVLGVHQGSRGSPDFSA